MSRALAALLLAATAATATQDTTATRSRRVLDLFVGGRYDEVYALFGPRMREAISAETFRNQSAQIAALGKPLEIGAPEIGAAPNLTPVTIPVRWQAVSLNFVVVWAQDGRIAGLWMRPANSQANRAATPRPPYSKPEAFTEREVTVGDDQWKLPGTLSIPKGKGPFPALVLVHGSGPQDRDETVGGHRVFRDLAEGLASRGLVVLRYDKRTRVHPAECAADPEFTMTQETVVDAVRATALLRTLPEVDATRVFVLGHSQGGYMMPRILRTDPKIAGAVVMAGSARPLAEVVRDQADYLLSRPGISAEQKASLEAMKKDPDSVLKVPASYRRDLADYRPATEARALSVPVLFLQGERDYQVTRKDLDLWREALKDKPSVRFITYPDLNHLFASGSGPSLPAEYARQGYVDAKVLDDIFAFAAKLR